MHNFPDFIIAGSAKSGTTALYMMLDQHPDVFMSTIKETNYFVHAYEPTRQFVAHNGKKVLGDQEEQDIIDTFEKYEQLFAGSTNGQLLGESSPWYLLNLAVPERIRQHNPSTKIVLILRNPTDVAFANFVHQVRDRSESLGVDQFDQLFDPAHYASEDAHPFSFHLELPRYSRHMPAFLESFPRENVHIMIYEEFVKDKTKSMDGLLKFLGLRTGIEMEMDRRVNISGIPKSSKLQDLIQGSMGAKRIIRLFVPTKPRRKVRAFIEALNTGKKPVLTNDQRARFDARFGDDVDYVEQVLGRPVDAWRAKRVE